MKLIWLLLLPSSFGIPLSDFFPYNRSGTICRASSGDDVADRLNDGSCETVLFPNTIEAVLLYEANVSLPFFNETITTITVDINGFLLLQGSLSDSHMPRSFPALGITVVSAFWNDIDIAENGDVYVRPSTDPEDLNKASQEIRESFVDMSDFSATWVFVVSWREVPYYSQGTLFNTFQLVLVTDGLHSFAISNYKDDGIKWSSVTRDGLGNGLEGTPAQAGYNDGLGVNYFVVPGSNTPDILSIVITSNVGIPGKWIFRLTYPSLSVNPLFFSRNIGDEILINCTPSDNTSEIGWLKNYEMINETDARISYLPDNLLRHVLVITDAQFSDQANYSCAFIRSGILIDVQRSEVIVYRDIVNIFNNGSQLVADAVINTLEYVGSGGGSGFDGPLMLDLFCITITGHENATWVNVTIDGMVDINYDSDYLMFSSANVSITSENFTVILQCISLVTRQSSTVTITTEMPYLRIVGSSFLLLPVGSRPLIEFVLAVYSDGTEELQNNVTELLTFTFTGSSQQQMELSLPTVTADNVQRYHYVVPSVGISTEGNYTLSVNDTQYGSTSVTLTVVLDVPQLAMVPQLVSRQFNSSITLNCTPSNETIPVSWTRNAAPIDDAVFLPNSTLKHILFINNAKMSDRGTYSCQLNFTGLPPNPQLGTVYVYKDPINILTDSGDVENGSVINDFSSGGELQLVCATTEGYEDAEWMLLKQSGTFQQNVDCNSVYQCFLMLSNTNEDLSLQLRCKSGGGNFFYKDVTVIKRNPYYQLIDNSLVNGTYIFAPVASSPVINIIIAIDSDGTLTHQNNVTNSLMFTHTNNNNMQIPINGLEPDPDNFQLYTYTFPPLQLRNNGTYTIFSEFGGTQPLDVTILLDVNITLLTLTRSFASVTLLEGDSVIISCTPNIIEAVLFWSYNGTNLTRNTEGIMFTPTGLNHNLEIVNPSAGDSGLYACHSTIEDQPVNETIRVKVVAACRNDFSGGLFWQNSRRNITVNQSCSMLHPSFRSGVDIRRQCRVDGSWSPVDLRDCTMFIGSDPVVVVYFTLVVVTNSTDDMTIVGQEILNDVFDQIRNNINIEVDNLVSRAEIYNSSTGASLLSFTLSFSLQTSPIPTSSIEDVKSILQTGDFLPDGYNLTSEQFSVLAFQPNLSCSCDIGTDNDDTIQSVCTGPSEAPCIMCGPDRCQCNYPTYVGNGIVCGLDSDYDGFPDVGLDCTLQPNCTADNCPTIYSVTDSSTQQQDVSFCTESNETVESGCPFNRDDVWNITWPATGVDKEATQKCPGGSEATGLATRQCIRDGQWASPNVSQCQTVEQIRLMERAAELSNLVDNIFRAENRDLTQMFMPEVVAEIVDDLGAITNSTQPILPRDVTSTAETLDVVITVTEVTSDDVDQPLLMEVIEDAVSVLDNLFDERNDVAFQQVNSNEDQSNEDNRTASVGEQLQMSTERVGILLGNTLNTSSNKTERSEFRGSNNNIFIEAQSFSDEDLKESEAIQFSFDTFTNNSMMGLMDGAPPMVEIPTSIVVQQMMLTRRRVAVVNSISRNVNLPTGRSSIESMILSSQLSTNPNGTLLSDPVKLTFEIGNLSTNGSFTPRCAFFNFSRRMFSDDGIEQLGSNGSSFQCTSSHLTSFAVLVDASGNDHSEALSIVSYIGCGISIVCLIITIVLLIVLKKKIFDQIQHFIHLNLSIALLLGLITFVSGIETATDYRASCLVVAILLHYFFLAAFSWMLCEGLLLFILLQFVFYKGLLKTKKFYFLVGWSLPIPIIVVSAAVSHEQYGINDRCWISEEKGAIWAFIGPMLLIILINTFFLITTVYRVYVSRSGKIITAAEVHTREAVKALVKASIILLPILGLTWLFGILAVNEDTVVFAWIFTILNSLQGLFILFLHVFRNEKFVKMVKSYRGKEYSTVSTSDKNATAATTSQYVDEGTRQRSLTGYNQVILNEYVTSSSNIGTGNSRAYIHTPNIFNVRTAADDFDFNEEDRLQPVSSWNPRSDSILTPVSPSEYLKHQRQAVVINYNAQTGNVETNI
ncbi:uncharacterized protein [Dysidea avara]